MPLSDATRLLVAARDAARRRAMGPPLAHSDDDLTDLARVRPSSLPEIEAFVRETAGEVGVALLNAEGDE